MASSQKMYTHGSEDSVDHDVFFEVDYISDVLDENKKTCETLSTLHNVNGNLIKIENGQVTKVFKGTVDEVNNSLLATYHLHQQQFPCPIIAPMKRVVGLKWLRVIRGILSHCSRVPEYRSLVKSALRSDCVFDKIETLRTLDFTKIDDFQKNDAVEVRKFIVFQIAQFIGLLDGQEVYTKSDAKKLLRVPEAIHFLNREPSSLEYLNFLVGDMLPYIDIAEFVIIPDGTRLVEENTIISVKTEKIIE